MTGYKIIKQNNINNFYLTKMGSFFTKVFDRLSGKLGDSRILMLGLDGAGKTTILFNMKLGEVVNTVPTIGFNMETVQYKNIEFSVWDVGGQERLRMLWHHYYEGTQGLIFAVDSSDVDRIDEAAETLRGLLSCEEMKGAPLLVYANKQDLPNALSVPQLTDRLGLACTKGRPWYVQGCVANRGDGLLDGLDWLCKNV